MPVNKGESPGRLLESICCPADIVNFSREQLKQLADELRQAIISNVSKTGGHFASNLGTVELTTSLYATHNIPPDKIIWDVGHQAYPHKMLTGRLDQFPTLRQYGGISGFLRRDESPFDVWGAGHASTSISAALGYAIARDKLKTNEHVVAILGDAALTGGMAWEALNNAGALNTDLTVILNDNKMSIAENVGALSTYLAKLRARPWFQNLEIQARHAAEIFPKSIQKTAAGLKHSVTYYVSPEETGSVFEGMGFNYIGPIDGHDLDVMLDVFSNAKELKGPVLIHVITVKGKGYEFAESDARKWHGVTPFGVEEGKFEQAPSGITYTQAFVDALIDVAENDEKIVAITAAMPDGTGLNKFKAKHPDRFFDVGIAEEHAVTFAAGLAAAGMKPVVAIYSSFLQRAYDMILHDVCLQNLPVKFMLDRAGLVGDDGATHHGVFDLSYLGMIPNIVVMAPRDTTEQTLMVNFALNYDEHPIAVRYPRGSSGEVNRDIRYTPIQLGKSELMRDGDDLAILAIGSMVTPAWEAANSLSSKGISAAVLNARFAKPLDEKLILQLARRIKHLIIIEENVATGGFGQSVISLLMREGLNDIAIKHLSIPDQFVEHGSISQLRADCGLNTEGIIRAACDLILNQAGVSPNAIGVPIST
ncbi:MAG: 1-deoxy-D-xylulose-5-phosphate synthase [bacterium]